MEEVIRDVLTDDAQRGALDFLAHLNRHGIPIQESENYWDIGYKGQNVCFVMVLGGEEAPGPWTIWSDQEPGSWAFWPVEGKVSAGGDADVDGQVRETAWAHVNRCASCGGDCSPGKRKTVLGREFDHLCSSALAFTNPDAAAVDCAKKMVDARIRDIDGV